MRRLTALAALGAAVLLFTPLAQAGDWTDGYSVQDGRLNWRGFHNDDCHRSGGCNVTVTPNRGGTRQVTEHWNTPNARGYRSFTVPGHGSGAFAGSTRNNGGAFGNRSTSGRTNGYDGGAWGGNHSAWGGNHARAFNHAGTFNHMGGNRQAFAQRGSSMGHSMGGMRHGGGRPHR